MQPMDWSPPASPLLTRYFEEPSPSSAIYKRYEAAIEKASGSKYDVVHAFNQLKDIEVELVFEEINRAFPCMKINRVSIPAGIANLHTLIQTQVQNPVLFSWLFCAFQTTVVNPVQNFNQPSASFETNIAATRQLMPVIKSLSTAATGAFGDVWRTLIINSYEIALLKTYINGYDRDHINHEFFITYHLNQLRDEIPNFVYGYGMFKCENPLRDKRNPKVCPDPLIDFDNEPIHDNRNYLIMEVITPGTPLTKVAWTMTVDRLMSVYLQVVSAVAVAYGRFHFTHYDLHAENVILQDTKKIQNPLSTDLRDTINQTVYIPYSFEGRTIYIKATMIAKIIDFGTSYLEVPDKINGVPTGQMMRFGNLDTAGWARRDATAPNPFHDLYLFSGRILKNLAHGVILDLDDRSNDVPANIPLFRSVYHIISRFPTFANVRDNDTFERVFAHEIGDDFTNSGVRDVPLHSARAFSDQIDHILRHYPQLRRNVIFIAGQDPLPIGAVVLTCDDNTCANWNDVQQLVTRN